MGARRSPRYQVRLQARYQVSKDDHDDTIHPVLNLAVGGCAIQTGSRSEKPGRDVVVTISVPPHADKLRLNGSVVWSHAPRLAGDAAIILPGKMGIAFADSPPPALLEYLDRLDVARQSSTSSVAPTDHSQRKP